MAYFILLMLSNIMTSCNQQDTSKMKIYPLHPYSASPTEYDSTAEKSRTFIVKYFFVQGAVKATEELSFEVDEFLTKSILNDSINFKDYGSYIVYVFKESSTTNQNYRNRGTDDTPGSHIDDDLLYQYTWEGRKFSKCEFYKNGNVTKTINNKAVLLSL